MRREITAIFLSALVSSGCGSKPIDLGDRGGTSAPGGRRSSQGDGGGVLDVGAAGGGSAGVASLAAGSSAQDAGAAGTGGQSGGAGAVAIGGMGQAATSGMSGAAGGTQVSTGCGSDPPTTDTSIMVGTMKGTYIVDLPKPYDKTRAYPLIMAFRGANVTADAFRGYLNLAALIGGDAILINLNCLGEATSWDTQRDVPYVDQLLEHMQSTYCIDESRVFAAGHGSGGFFTSTLGCMRGDKLRGIAPLSGGPPSGTCQGESAVWASQGNTDPGIGSGRAGRDYWVRRNRCDATSSIPVAPSPCVEYTGCDPGMPVRYCEYNGDLGLPDFAASGVWDFFRGL